MPSIEAVTPVKKPKWRNEWCAIWLQKLTTSAIEHPTISMPPTSSPQRILLSRMNAANTSENERRGGGTLRAGRVGDRAGGGGGALPRDGVAPNLAARAPRRR